ncbi:MAG: hypothetical protein Q9M92_03980 [Enterobacterales bacterium]|nr:hypothetical protein [Enterobacterales bacterium]
MPFNWSKEQALSYSSEVSKILTSDKATSFYHSMYGNDPDQWNSNYWTTDRYRVITNVLSPGMCYCYPDGRLELTIKSPPKSDQTDSRQLPLQPWFSFNREKYKGTILFGHWAALREKQQ